MVIGCTIILVCVVYLQTGSLLYNRHHHVDHHHNVSKLTTALMSEHREPLLAHTCHNTVTTRHIHLETLRRVASCTNKLSKEAAFFGCSCERCRNKALVRWSSAWRIWVMEAWWSTSQSQDTKPCTANAWNWTRRGLRGWSVGVSGGSGAGCGYRPGCIIGVALS